jgi:septal ring factor EnvC (AmiA/AmiB activator)
LVASILAAVSLARRSRSPTEIETEWRRLETDLAKLADDRRRLEDAIADNRRRRAVSALDLEDERRRARGLAREAATLDALVSRSEAAGRRSAAAVTQSRGESGRAAPFGALERGLPMPVAGAVLRDFGALTEDGTPA